MTARKEFDLFDGLLYLGIKLIFGKRTPPIEKVLRGRPAAADLDLLFDGDEFAANPVAVDARKGCAVLPTSMVPSLVMSPVCTLCNAAPAEASYVLCPTCMHVDADHRQWEEPSHG